MNKLRTFTFLPLVISISLAMAGCSEKKISPQSALNEAQAAVTRGDFAAATIHLKNALAGKPDDAQSRFSLGKVYLAMGEFGLAEADLRRALELGIAQETVLPLLLESMVLQAQHQRVIDEVAKAKNLSAPLEAIALSYTGRSWFGLKKFDQAKADFAKSLKLAPENAAASIGEVTTMLISAPPDFAAAKKATAVVLAKHPSSHDAWAMSGFLSRLEGKNSDAKIALEKALQLKPYDIEQHAALAKTLIDLSDFPAATAQIQNLFKLSPKNFIVTYLYGLMAFRQGNLQLSREHLQRVVVAAPSYEPALELASEVAMSTGEFAMAEKLAASIVDQNPRNPSGHRLLASTYLAQNQPERAIAVLQPLLQQKVSSPQILATVGEALIRTGSAAKGIEFLDAAAAMSGGSAGLTTISATARIAEGDMESGLAQLERASANSRNPQTDLAIAQAFASAKRFDKATLLADRFVKAQPKEASGPHALGMIALAQDKIEDAEKQFAQALAINASYLPTLDGWAQIDLRRGRADAAKARYTTALALEPKNVSILLSLAALNVQTSGPETETLRLFNQAREVDPSSPRAVIVQSQYLLSTSQAEAAIALLEPMVANHANDLSANEALANAYQAGGVPIKAIQVLEKQLLTNSLSASLNYRIGSLRLGLRDFAGATKNFERAAQLQPNAIEPKVALAGTLLNSGKRVEAMAAARAIQAANPKSPIGYMLVGDFFANDNNAAEAQAQYKQAYSLAKNTSTASKLYSNLIFSNNKEEAAQFLRAHWQASPTDLSFMLQASELLLNRKEWKEAVAVVNQVLKVSKGNTAALNNAAVAMHQLKEVRAVELAQRAYELEPNNFAIQDTLGFILLEQGKVAEALPLLKSAAAKATRNPEVRLHYAQALAKKGDTAAAKQEATAALQNSPPPDVKTAAEALLK
jgi:putative PEP-CTERM system TPR-repeat lipoprotein